jgi:hypothetical protein
VFNRIFCYICKDGNENFLKNFSRRNFFLKFISKSHIFVADLMVEQLICSLVCRSVFRFSRIGGVFRFFWGDFGRLDLGIRLFRGEKSLTFRWSFILNCSSRTSNRSYLPSQISLKFQQIPKSQPT